MKRAGRRNPLGKSFARGLGEFLGCAFLRGSGWGGGSESVVARRAVASGLTWAIGRGIRCERSDFHFHNPYLHGLL